MAARGMLTSAVCLCLLFVMLHQMSSTPAERQHLRLTEQSIDEILGTDSDVGEPEPVERREAAVEVQDETTAEKQENAMEKQEPVVEKQEAAEERQEAADTALPRQTFAASPGYQYELANGVKIPRPWTMPFERLPPRARSLPFTDDAPVGENAMRLARSWGLPDTWNARHHPTNFILGAPKAGTTFLERCYHSGAFAGGVRRPYPKPALRWPTRFAKGEPFVTNTVFIGGVWNRTGFRRWDLQKEPRTYRKCGPPGGLPYYTAFEQFPPIDNESRHWDVMDATPTYIHSTHAAENIHADHAHDLGKVRFVLGVRDGMDRAFSHYVMIASVNGGKQGGGGFLTRMNNERSLWNRKGCDVLANDPGTLLEDTEEAKRNLRWVLLNCFANPSYLGLSLPVLGLRYYLHLFDASQFTILRINALKKSTPDFVLSTLSEAFGHTPIPPPCEPGVTDFTSCTGPVTWDRISKLCSDPSASGRSRQASYSSRSEALGISKGSEEEQAPFRELFAKYDQLLLDVVARHRVRFVEE